MKPSDDEHQGPVIRDRRRIDPQTGQVRDPAGPAGPAGGGDAALAEVRTQLAERTADLQRLQAEYANYRKRVERDRVAVGTAAIGGTVLALLPVLDDIDRARQH